MKNKILMVSILSIVSLFAFNAYAVGPGSGIHEPGTGLENPELKAENQGTGQGLQNQEQLQENTTAGVQNQNQVQNRGEDNQIQAQNNEQEGASARDEGGSIVAEQRRSVVANAVQELLQVAERNGGIGQQVRVIAQTQTQNQEKLETSLEKIQNRGGFAKFLVGPKYSEIKNAEKILEQNREQVEKLNQVKNQIANQGDQQTLIQQVQALEQANMEIENSLGKELKGFSLFGWLVRAFQ